MSLQGEINDRHELNALINDHNFATTQRSATPLESRDLDLLKRFKSKLDSGEICYQ